MSKFDDFVTNYLELYNNSISIPYFGDVIIHAAVETLSGSSSFVPYGTSNSNTFQTQFQTNAKDSTAEQITYTLTYMFDGNQVTESYGIYSPLVCYSALTTPSDQYQGFSSTISLTNLGGYGIAGNRITDEVGTQTGAPQYTMQPDQVPAHQHTLNIVNYTNCIVSSYSSVGIEESSSSESYRCFKPDQFTSNAYATGLYDSENNVISSTTPVNVMNSFVTLNLPILVDVEVDHVENVQEYYNKTSRTIYNFLGNNIGKNFNKGSLSSTYFLNLLRLSESNFSYSDLTLFSLKTFCKCVLQQIKSVTTPITTFQLKTIINNCINAIESPSDLVTNFAENLETLSETNVADLGGFLKLMILYLATINQTFTINDTSFTYKYPIGATENLGSTSGAFTVTNQTTSLSTVNTQSLTLDMTPSHCHGPYTLEPNLTQRDYDGDGSDSTFVQSLTTICPTDPSTQSGDNSTGETFSVQNPVTLLNIYQVSESDPSTTEMYYVDRYHNTLYVGTNEYSLTVGYYSSSNLANMFNNVVTGVVMSYNSSSNTYTFTSTATFYFGASSTCLALLGFQADTQTKNATLTDGQYVLESTESPVYNLTQFIMANTTLLNFLPLAGMCMSLEIFDSSETDFVICSNNSKQPLIESYVSTAYGTTVGTVPDMTGSQVFCYTASPTSVVYSSTGLTLADYISTLEMGTADGSTASVTLATDNLAVHYHPLTFYTFSYSNSTSQNNDSLASTKLVYEESGQSSDTVNDQVPSQSSQSAVPIANASLNTAFYIKINESVFTFTYVST